MPRIFLFVPLCLFLLSSLCYGYVNRTPGTVVSALLTAAKRGKDSKLKKLCLPGGRSDRMCKRICANTKAKARAWKMFVKTFSRGKILKEATSGNQSVVHLALGKHGRVWLRLQRVGKHWYLRAFLSKKPE